MKAVSQIGKKLLRRIKYMAAFSVQSSVALVHPHLVVYVARKTLEDEYQASG
ncbi:hypothetical protein [Gorillibacterium sp. CAU 1737]|uniref:hypothetical protein n=1 Tax=Gorillibacterium sp. CAU 1737 TaxID=3140362 RepID=UPI0032604F7E